MQRPSKATNEEDKDFIDVSGNKDKGILKKILKEGDGNLCPEGVVAIVHYTGKLTNGTVFDSSRKRRAPFTFNIGRRQVILGWDKGVATMQRGEICIMKLAPEYAYGSGGVGPIPPNSTLIFEIELVGWKQKSPDLLGLPIERVGQLLGIVICFVFAYYYFIKS
eukprot:CAMPEP_0114418916 /NCGR_PEP_ID=MMETSP0103-20121206/3751_1 /TAXON_ID=37642 ORGANISM="Paraphysomonas imperforata, Strain PA2" /NCGR_SAMPLE_ID=MMETSP0103 /ASSEMBLY_ACC=CAM_ASM_000201 /LENGTH=163 /DNA_ID=CAMNT_0001587305 /DNA_START=18 /DNA_END=509 /DNA_ORIENTATION=+